MLITGNLLYCTNLLNFLALYKAPYWHLCAAYCYLSFTYISCHFRVKISAGELRTFELWDPLLDMIFIYVGINQCIYFGRFIQSIHTLNHLTNTCITCVMQRLHICKWTSYYKVSWRPEATTFGFRLFQSLWHLAGTSEGALSRHLSNCRAIRSL